MKNILYINTGLQYAYNYDKYYVQTTALADIVLFITEFLSTH